MTIYCPILLSLIRENLARETRHMSGTTQMMHLFSLPETFYPSNFLKSQKPLIEEIHKDLSDAIASYDNITTL
jgi:hypothetical protein